MDVFKSKIDKWLTTCFALSIIACLLGASVMLEEGGAFYNAIAALTLIAGAGFPLWVFVSTKYIVRNGDLKIISGPFSWIIPVESIKSVQEAQNSFTNPALSFDRLEITYSEDKVIFVSPADKTQFMRKLSDEGFARMDKNAKRQVDSKTTKNNSKKKSRKQPKSSDPS